MRKILCTFPFLFFLTLLSAQNTPSPVNIDYTPPSPNASSLGKFGDIPVSNYTGIPEVKIPIYTIKSKYLSLPIALNYHAGGVRVEETASSVGLSWSLNAGGIISRTTRGLADEKENRGYIRIGPIPTLTPQTLETYVNFQKGILDGQADLFNFNFGSHIGKFVINKSHEVIKAPRSRMKLEFELGVENNVDLIRKWVATGEDGTKYIFESREYTTLLETVNMVGETPPVSESPTPVVSSWYLTKMISANGLEEYTFQYEPYTIEYYQGIVETHYYLASKPFSKTRSKIRVVGQRLVGITFPHGQVTFEYSSGDRCDLIGDKALKRVIVEDGELEKEFELQHSYFGTNGTVEWATCSGASDPELRLRLDQVIENPLTAPKHHRFEYHDETWLPDKFSHAQDHWGYYNGKGANTTLVPKEYFSVNFGGDLIQAVLPGGIRDSDKDHIKAGSIKRIHYPTGGYTEFDFEINDCQSEELPNHVELQSASLTGLTPIQQNIYISKIDRPFVVLNVGALVSNLGDPSCYLILSISGNGFGKDLQYYHTTSSTTFESFVVNIPVSGYYTISVALSNNIYCEIEDPFNFIINWENEIQTITKDASGLRVKKVTDYPLIGKEKTKYYTYKTVQGGSSGGVLTTPKYGYYYQEYNPNSQQMPNILYYARTQFTNNPMALTQGAVVGYSRVLISDDSLNMNGYTELTYTSPMDFPDEYSNVFYPHLSCLEFPFAPVESREWRRGLLLSRKNFKRVGDNYQLLDSETNTYTYYSEFVDELNSVPSVKTGIYALDIVQGTIQDLRVHHYEFKSSKQVLAKTIRQSFHEENILSDTITYQYTSDYFLSLSQRNAGGVTYKTQYYYPEYYEQNLQMDSLVQANILNQPIAIESWVTAGGNSYLTAAQATEFDQPEPGVFHTKVNWYFEGKVHNTTLSPLTTADVVRDRTLYERTVRILSRDATGNVTALLDRDSLPIVYIWDYLKRYAIAKVIRANEEEVYHTSFEDKGVTQNTTADHKTGRQARQLNNGSFVFTSLVSPQHGNNYILTYWWKSTLQSEWQLQTETYTNYQNGQPLQTAKSTGYIDELRFYPEDAEMLTYTYLPGVGVLSITDTNHVSAYFEYDDSSRLTGVRDEQGNILTHYKYHYINPATN